MQTTGYLIIGGKRILVLVQHKRYSRLMKVRKSGKEGNRFEDEESYLSQPENCELLDRLLQGKTIEL